MDYSGTKTINLTNMENFQFNNFMKNDFIKDIEDLKGKIITLIFNLAEIDFYESNETIEFLSSINFDRVKILTNDSSRGKDGHYYSYKYMNDELKCDLYFFYKSQNPRNFILKPLLDH